MKIHFFFVKEEKPVSQKQEDEKDNLVQIGLQTSSKMANDRIL